MTRTMTNSIVAGLGLMLATACSAPDVPANPTWADDVQPILAAKCVRCHGDQPIQGAPAGFRLDRYDDTFTDDGFRVLGAANMAPWIQLRTDPAARSGFTDTGAPLKSFKIDLMPPEPISLTDEQHKTIFEWANPQKFADGRPLRGDVSGHGAAVTLTRSLADSVSDGLLTIQYDVRDPTGLTMPSGELCVATTGNPAQRIGELHLGPGEVVWDVGAAAEDSYTVFAVLDNLRSAAGRIVPCDEFGVGQPCDSDRSMCTNEVCNETATDVYECQFVDNEDGISVGSFDVTHADGNTAPTISQLTPNRDSILSDAASPTTVSFVLSDPDAGDTHTMTVEVFTPDQRILLRNQAAVSAGVVQIPWDTTTFAASPNWQMTVTVSDGTATRSKTSGRFVISHGTTTLTYDDVRGVFLNKCGTCHPGSAPDIVFTQRLGAVYRRVVRTKTMPPQSFRTFTVFGEPEDADPQITQADRDRIGEWILAGAPGNPNP